MLTCQLLLNIVTGMTALDRAIEACGSQAELARRIGLAQQYVNNWKTRSSGRVPGEHCIKIEQATEGKVTRYDLRPDVFGVPAQPSNDPAQAAA